MQTAAVQTAGRGYRGGSGAPPLATVVYSSRAVTPFSDPELQSLMHTAQARNHQEGVTGVVLYDNSRFFQWLEGPANGVERIMGSIRNDRRHTDVQVITERASDARQFDGWDMKLAAQGADPSVWRGEILEPPPEIVEDLHRQPAAAPTLLVKLVPPPEAAGDSPLAASLKGAALSQETAKILKSVILSKVIPRLLDSHGLPATGPANPRAAELAELLVASDQAASLALIRELRGDHPDARHLFAPLVEPAARSLGDLWADDLVSEFEVTLGLCRLQSAVRLLNADTKRTVLRGGQPKVMIAPAPGELHQLVAALDSEWLWSEGWAPKSEFPADDRALTDLLSTTWVDILDLSLSAAFPREESLPHLTRTIALARRASLNPNVVVVVGGRAFVEDRTVGLDVGADLASRTSMNVDRLMGQGVKPKI
jgi:methanogenic corrinoid protein MtbC1